MVEQAAHNGSVGGSKPSGPTGCCKESDAPVPPDPASPPRKKRNIAQWLWGLVGLVVLLLALWGIRKIAGQVTLAEIRADIAATPIHLFVFAGLSAVCSYIVLIGYDWLAVRHLGYRLPLRTLAAASFGSFTMSHTLGLTVLTGGTVRYRMYTRAGIHALDIALIIALCGWTFWLGVVVVAGLGLLIDPHLATPFRNFAPGWERWTGILLLAGAGAYTLFATLYRRPIKLWHYSFTLPDGRETLLQIVIGAVDLAFAGGALYLLLPDIGAPGLLTVLTIYAVAMVSGALSHAPGGLGVFELIVVALLPASPKAGVLAALVLFRLIYTYIPFFLGLAVIGWTEVAAFRLRRGEVRRAAATP